MILVIDSSRYLGNYVLKVNLMLYFKKISESNNEDGWERKEGGAIFYAGFERQVNFSSLVIKILHRMLQLGFYNC